MSPFFVSWELWEKMTFCLGLAIGLAIFLGCGKNLYSRWRLRSYTSVQGDIANPTPSMTEAQVRLHSETPFGIRALERGVKIEGVWVSQTNTPNASRPGSMTSSVAPSSISSFLDEPTTPSFAIMERPGGRNESIVRIQGHYTPVKRTSDTTSTASWVTTATNTSTLDHYRPHPSPSAPDQRTSLSFSSTISDDSMNDMRLAKDGVPDDRTSAQRSAQPIRLSPDGGGLLRSDSNSGSEVDTLYDSKSANSLPEIQISDHDQKGTRTEGADLGLLHSHRLSHVAETGQLIPRTKAITAVSGEWTRIAPAREARPRAHPPISMNNRRISRSLPPASSGKRRSMASNGIKPQIGVGTAAALPDVNFSKSSAPASRKSQLKATTNVVDDDDDDIDTHFDAQRRDTGVISAIATIARPRAVHALPSFEHERGAQILRKVNDTFEILQPGTIAPVTGQQASEMKGSIDGRNGAKRRTRRLSKERPSGERDRSSFIDILYGIEQRDTR